MLETQRHEGAKKTEITQATEALASEIVDSAFKVHKYFGPGLLESIYEAALCKEFSKRGLKFTRQVRVPLFYDEEPLDEYFVIDLIVDDKIVLELKACERLLPVHKSQTLSYLYLANKPLGFLINFNNVLIKNGIVRLINERFAS
jgi:GxxExxY protein